MPKRPREGSAKDRGRGKVLRFRAPGVPDVAEPLPVHKRAIPGVIAGAADLDPAAVMTATVAGATYGLSVAWIVLLCIPILKSVFGVSARIGHETRLGLIKLIRIHFGRTAAMVLACMVVAVNVLMIVADLMAVSDGFSIVLMQPRSFFPAIVAFIVWYILTLVGYQRVNQTLSLLALVLFAYVAAAFMAVDSVFSAAKQIVLPQLHTSSGYVLALIALFGSLLTPDVIVWQTSTKREQGASFHDAESQLGCVFAAIISLSAVVAASKMSIADPNLMTTRQAAQALAPLGDLGPILFSLGIIGSGLVALPILVASLCFSISEAADWDYGLSKPPWEAPRFFFLICFVLVSAVIVNYFGINTVKTLYWSQILAGMFIVPIIFFIFWISNDRRIMHTINTKWQNFWLGAAVGGMIAANLLFFVHEIFF
jgi:Mn2+/Fe2+ NRAMP family transporter